MKNKVVKLNFVALLREISKTITNSSDFKVPGLQFALIVGLRFLLKKNSNLYIRITSEKRRYYFHRLNKQGRRALMTNRILKLMLSDQEKMSLVVSCSDLRLMLSRPRGLQLFLVIKWLKPVRKPCF